MNRKNLHKNLGIAACAVSVTPTGEVQLFPAGEFRANDGRPKDAPHWYIDAELAAAIIADFEARQNDTVIDYEHQTMLTVENGQPAPAAGWFSKLEWRGDGLYAVDVRWTERATGLIEGEEYKYISPVFTYDKKTGAIKSLLNAALTNNPALDGMEAVAASQLLINQHHDKETLKMEGLMEQLRWLLNLPVTSTAEEITAELQKAIDQIKAAAASAASLPGFDVVALIKTQAEQIAALTATAANPDPAKYVAVSVMQALQNEVTALHVKINKMEVDDLVEVALSSGKLLPHQEDWARSCGEKNLKFLKDYLATAQPIAALTKTQTDGNPPTVTTNEHQLDENQLAVCAAMGVAPVDFAKTLQAQQAQA